MTSTHVDDTNDLASLLTAAPADSLINYEAVAANGELDTVDDASFSDPYEEQDDQEAAIAETSSNVLLQNAEVDDDYAMTFDSDGEAGSDKQDIPDANTDPQPPPTPAPIPVTDSSSVAIEPAPFIVEKNLPDPPTSHTFSPSAADAGDAPMSTSGPAESTSNETVPPQAMSHSYENVANGEIDIQQLLDNITATAELNAANASSPTFPPGTTGFPPHASLPPRPQVIQKSPILPGYNIQDDMRMYHAGPPGYPPPSLSSYRPPGVPGSLIAAGAPGTSTDARNMLPPPPSASFHPPPSLSAPPPLGHSLQPQPQPQIPPQDRPAHSIESGDTGEIQWPPQVQKLYDEFLADERMYVSEGLWDRFPVGSRLFIGNLPTEKVTKRDIFYAFYKYGKLAQVSIKQAYGFVQFHDAAACYTALQREQGQEIRGRTMHLEISKPQKNTRGSGGAAPPVVSRRSRSPDYSRNGRNAQAPARGTAVDRYDTRAPAPVRDNGFRAPARTRDDYRPGRSPSPTRGNYRGRDEYATTRGRDYYEGRERRRSRSRSPAYGRRDAGRYRERSFSPRGREAEEDFELSMPRRNPQDVPEVQIILMDELDRNFVAWVEGELRARGLKTEVMILGPRTPIASVIRRQIVEGVLAVAQLTRRSQETSKIPLQVFDRKGGANNVRFDEYQDLEPKIAAELVLRDKKAQIAPPPQQQQYGQPQYAAPQAYQPAPAAAAPNLASLVGQLDNATLQKLLGTLNTTAQPQSAPAIDLAGLLGGLTQQAQYQQPQQPPQQYGAVQAAAPNLASLLGSAAGVQAQQQQQAQAQAQGPQSAQQVQNIMAQLARFRQ